MEIEVYKKNNQCFIIHHRKSCVVVSFGFYFDENAYAFGNDSSYEKCWKSEWNPVFYKGKHHDESTPLELVLITGKTPEAWYAGAVNKKRQQTAKQLKYKMEIKQQVKERAQIYEEVSKARVILAEGKWLPSQYIFDLQEKIGIPRGSNYL